MGIAIRGLTWTPHGGSPVDIQRSDLAIYLQIMAGIDEMPEVRGTDITVPGLSGRLMTNRIDDRLSIELVGVVMGEGDDETVRQISYRSMVSALQAAFDPTSYGTLVVTLEDSTTRSIVARPLNLVWGDEQAVCVRVLSIALEQVTGMEAAAGS